MRQMLSSFTSQANQQMKKDLVCKSACMHVLSSYHEHLLYTIHESTISVWIVMMYCNGRNIAWNVIAIAYCTMHETTRSASVIGMIIV